MKAKEIAELLDEPACEHNKKEKSGCSKPKPGATDGGCAFDGARGLRGIVEAALRHSMFELPEKAHLRRCTIETDEAAASGLHISEIFRQARNRRSNPRRPSARNRYKILYETIVCC